MGPPRPGPLHHRPARDIRRHNRGQNSQIKAGTTNRGRSHPFSRGLGVTGPNQHTQLAIYVVGQCCCIGRCIGDRGVSIVADMGYLGSASPFDLAGQRSGETSCAFGQRSQISKFANPAAPLMIHIAFHLLSPLQIDKSSPLLLLDQLSRLRHPTSKWLDRFDPSSASDRRAPASRQHVAP